MAKILDKENKVLRHTSLVRSIHWVVAISTFVLFFSGFGQMPLYKRYMLTDVLPWTGDYWLTLKMHYIAAVFLTVAAVWHAVYHFIRREFGLWPRRGDLGQSVKIVKAMLTGKEEPPSDKYLAEQRLAYAYIAFGMALVIVTGLVKMAKNLGWILNDSVLFWATQLHNLAAVLLLLGVFAHLAAFLLPPNHKLLPSMFTGKVDLDYIKHRHSIWYAKLTGGQKDSGGGIAAGKGGKGTTA